MYTTHRKPLRVMQSLIGGWGWGVKSCYFFLTGYSKATPSTLRTPRVCKIINKRKSMSTPLQRIPRPAPIRQARMKAAPHRLRIRLRKRFTADPCRCRPWNILAADPVLRVETPTCLTLEKLAFPKADDDPVHAASEFLGETLVCDCARIVVFNAVAGAVGEFECAG